MPMFKINEVAYIYRNGNFDGELTLDETYYVIKYHRDEGMYTLTNDKGKKDMYPKELFKIVK